MVFAWSTQLVHKGRARLKIITTQALMRCGNRVDCQGRDQLTYIDPMSP